MCITFFKTLPSLHIMTENTKSVSIYNLTVLFSCLHSYKILQLRFILYTTSKTLCLSPLRVILNPYSHDQIDTILRNVILQWLALFLCWFKFQFQLMTYRLTAPWNSDVFGRSFYNQQVPPIIYHIHINLKWNKMALQSQSEVYHFSECG